MASILSAGTTTSTALNLTADVSGILQLASNNGTTALTINTTQAIGVGSSPSYGTSGQVLTSSGSGAAPTWTTVSAASLATPSFTTTIGVGGATASASGSGISFPATQSASSNANTLDDYEEGTFTPVVSGNGSSPNQACYGMYTKVGRAIVCTVRIVLGSSSTCTDFGGFSGLPFTSASLTGNIVGGGGGRESGATGGFWQASVNASDTTVSVGKPDNNNTVNANYAFNFHFTYQTT